MTANDINRELDRAARLAAKGFPITQTLAKLDRLIEEAAGLPDGEKSRLIYNLTVGTQHLETQEVIEAICH